MSRRSAAAHFAALSRGHMRAAPHAAPEPVRAPTAPLSGRLPEVGDEVEVVVMVPVLCARVRRLDPEWARDRVSELRYQDAAPGFTTQRGARPRLSEEGVRWRWPDATKSITEGGHDAVR